MSTTPMPESATGTVPPPPAKREVVIYSHSTLLYWWPVWATGYLMALITFWDGTRMAIVPKDTIPVPNAVIQEHADSNEKLERNVLELPKGTPLFSSEGKGGKPDTPFVHMSGKTKLGVLFSIVLLLVIVISNVPLRGLMSVVVILGIFLIVLILYLVDVVDTLAGYFLLLQIHINAAGYLFISVCLSIIWGMAIFVFDKRNYVVVTPGEVRVCNTFEGGETAYAANGVKFAKRQTDLFRRILGWNAGDLIINPTGHAEIDMPNVVHVGNKIRKIEDMLREQKVV